MSILEEMRQLNDYYRVALHWLEKVEQHRELIGKAKTNEEAAMLIIQKEKIMENYKRAKARYELQRDLVEQLKEVVPKV